MHKVLGLTTVAFLGAAACLTVAGTTPAAAVEQAGLTQELSAACKIVKTYRWNNGHRVAVTRKSCSPSYGSYGYRSYAHAPNCRYVVKTRIDNGRRVSVRTRVCG